MPSPLTDKLLREAFFARDKTFRLPRLTVTPSTQAANELLKLGFVAESGRRMDLQGRVIVLYRLTPTGEAAARALAKVK